MLLHIMYMFNAYLGIEAEKEMDNMQIILYKLCKLFIHLCDMHQQLSIGNQFIRHFSGC